MQALPDGYTQSYTYDGKIYAYAPDAWVGGVFYNKALFAENDLSVPETWEDFLAAAKSSTIKASSRSAWLLMNCSI